MSGHEVLQYVKTFTEVGLDRQLDSTSCRISHQTTHTGKLFDLLVRTTGSGIRHHEDVIVFIKTGKQGVCQLIVSCLPCLHNLFVTLFLCDESSLIVLCDPVYCILRFLDHLRLLRRHGHVRDRNRHGSSRGELISDCLYVIQHFRRLCCPVCVDDLLEDLFQLFLSYMEINFKKEFISFYFSVNKSEILRNDLVEQESSERRIDRSCLHCSVRHCLGHTHLDLGMQCDVSVLICKDRLADALKE